MTDVAWAAGLFEGEGCFSLRRATGHHSVHLHASLTMTDEEVVRKFHRVVGLGNVQFTDTRKTRPEHRPVWRWAVNGDDTRAVYEMLEPWLGTRRHQRYAEMLAERLAYERDLLPRRYEHRKYLDRKRDPVTGRFVFSQGRLGA